MLHLLAKKEGLDYIQTFSGGTEATAFNHRMVAAVKEMGISLEQYGHKENPLYITADEHYLFSKKYDHSFNPSDKLVAVTVCGDADENCPFIPGTLHRFHLGYVDPKFSDDTEEEGKVYFDKVVEVGREMMVLVCELKLIVNN